MGRPLKKRELALRELIDEILEMIQPEGWHLSVEDVLSILEIRHESYFRFIYSRRNSPADHFGPENVEDLIDLLADSGFPSAEREFTHAGLFLPEPDRAALLEMFVSIAMHRLHNHVVERDLLETALAGCRNPMDGFAFYCDSVIGWEEIINFTVGIFMERSGVINHPYSVKLMRDSIREQIRRRVIRTEDLLDDILKRLRERAIFWNLIDPRYLDLPVESIEEELRGALAVFGFDPRGKIPSRDHLKERYRSLMKRYHPDVNPEGLEKSRTITSSYAALLSRLYDTE